MREEKPAKYPSPSKSGKGKSGKKGKGPGKGKSDPSKRELEKCQFCFFVDCTQTARLLEVSCVSEQSDIPTLFEHRWTIKETERIPELECERTQE